MLMKRLRNCGDVKSREKIVGSVSITINTQEKTHSIKKKIIDQ